MITIATIFVGRLGLVFSSLAVIILLMTNKRILAVSIGLGSLLFNTLYHTIKNSTLNELKIIDIDRTLDWAFGIFIKGGFVTNETQGVNSVIAYLKGLTPITPSSLLLGTGLITRIDGIKGNYCNVDYGYIHTIYAIGLPLALFFYIGLAGFFINLSRSQAGKHNKISIILICCMFIFELKEPFIFKYSVPFFIFIYLSFLKYGQNPTFQFNDRMN